MNRPHGKETLDLTAVSILTILCVLWGLNNVAVKISNLGIAPIYGAGIRSVIASLGLIAWMKFRRMPLFPGNVPDGLFVGILFGAEFGFLYTALFYTTVSSASILLYTTPFFHALGAHYLLKGDRLSTQKVIGLVLAFAGIVLLLSKHVGLPSIHELLGDLFAVAAAILWAATTIYVKRRLVGKVSPYHTLFYQILFSIPILLLLSLIFEEEPVRRLSGLILFSMAYQGIVVAFVSYLVWFSLVHTYPVSRLSAFTFLTPVFATLAAVFFLHEPLTLQVMLSLALVSIGIYMVNRQ